VCAAAPNLDGYGPAANNPRMRYRVLVQLKADRVVELDAKNADEAFEKAEDAAFPGRHRRDKVKTMIAPGFPKKSTRKKSKPSVGVPS
jgi:hypothetical protein